MLFFKLQVEIAFVGLIKVEYLLNKKCQFLDSSLLELVWQQFIRDQKSCMHQCEKLVWEFHS